LEYEDLRSFCAIKHQENFKWVLKAEALERELAEQIRKFANFH